MKKVFIKVLLTISLVSLPVVNLLTTDESSNAGTSEHTPAPYQLPNQH